MNITKPHHISHISLAIPSIGQLGFPHCKLKNLKGSSLNSHILTEYVAHGAFSHLNLNFNFSRSGLLTISYNAFVLAFLFPIVHGGNITCLTSCLSVGE